jgi:hypothetical protein
MFDLFTIVIVLSLSLKMAFDLLRELQGSSHAMHSLIADRLLYVEGLLFAAGILMAGAGLGLRNCHLLKIDAQWKRTVAIVCGMFALPALIGLFAPPLLMTFSDANSTLILALVWLGSMAATAVNATLTLKTFSLDA